ncbi:NrdR family transcriptional regulator [Methylorubrum aminovorans]
MLRCPYCASGENRVIDTRHQAQCIKRRRSCMSCGNRWNTTETAESLMSFAAADLSTEKLHKTQHLASGTFAEPLPDTRAITASILNVRRPLLRD